MIKLYDSKLSGNSWKVRLLLRHLGIAFERVTLNLAQGDHKATDFVARNCFARVPVLELENGTHLVESNAILLYLAEGTPLLPAEPVARAGVAAWLFYDQGDLSRFLAYPRFFAMTGQTERHADTIALYKGLAEAALGPVEATLSGQPWLAGSAPTVADFALYPYLRLSPEGGFDLSGRPAIRDWLARFEALPGYEPLVQATAR